MIIRDKGNWFTMLFVLKGSVLPQLTPRLILLFLFSCAVWWTHATFFQYKIPLNPAPFTLFGIALAMFLGFRNSASYDRFWEGRKVWGSLLINARILARQALTFPPAGNKTASLFIDQVIAMVYSLKHELRHTDPSADLQRLLPAAQAAQVMQARYRPVVLVSDLARWIKQSGVDSIQQAAMDETLNKLSECIGACERLANTPVPFTYSVLTHRTVYVYCLLLPFGLIDSVGWMMPIIVTFIGFTFAAIDAIAAELEEPFGTSMNDLALDAMCLTIENSLLEIDQRDPNPQQLKPVRGFYIT